MAGPQTRDSFFTVHVWVESDTDEILARIRFADRSHQGPVARGEADILENVASVLASIRADLTE